MTQVRRILQYTYMGAFLFAGCDKNGTTDGTTDGNTDGNTDGTTDEEDLCPRFTLDSSNLFQCSVPVDCENELCSSSASAALFDEMGCMRPRCFGDDDCENGDVCFIALECDENTCFPYDISCVDEIDNEGSTYCACTTADACADLTGWCIPLEEWPTGCDRPAT